MSQRSGTQRLRKAQDRILKKIATASAGVSTPRTATPDDESQGHTRLKLKPVADEETLGTKSTSASEGVSDSQHALSWGPHSPDSMADNPHALTCGPRTPEGRRTGRPQAARRHGQPERSVEDDQDERPSFSSDATTLSGDGEVPQIARGELSWFDKIGAGVTAQVFRGEWNGQAVAIKQLHLNFVRRGAMAKQQVAFCRETHVAAKICHNNLVQFYGISFDRQPWLMITEFMSGGTVFDLLHGENPVLLRWKQRLRMCSDIASAMDYLHKFNPQIIHRDLKSLNLLLSQAIASSRDVPAVKVSDFGLAKMKEDRDDWGMMTAAVGSFHWMAPEVMSGKYDEKADVFSFAMVLFEVICYEIPFQELNPSEVSEAVCCGARPRLDPVPKDCPEALMKLMINCWTQDPERRPSFTQIRTALNTISFSMLG